LPFPKEIPKDEIKAARLEATQAYFSYVEEPIADANEDSALIWD
jgi:hypothetical protein